jgi:hypothetical protein
VKNLELRRLSPRTAEEYQSYLRWFVEGQPLGRMPIASVTSAMVGSWLAEVRASMGALMVARVYSFVSSVFNAAVRDGVIDRMPCTVRGASNAPWAAPKTIASPDEVAALMQVVPDRYRALVSYRPASTCWLPGLGKGGGQRVGEAQVRIQWPVPGDGLVRAGGVVLGPVVVGVGDQRHRSHRGAAARTSASRSRVRVPVLPCCAYPGAHVPQLRSGSDEVLEPKRVERAAVVRHDRDRRDDVAVAVAGTGVDQGGGQTSSRSRPGRTRSLRSRRAGSRSGTRARALALRPVVPTASDTPGAAGRGLELGEVELATFVLVGGGQDQPLVTRQAQHGGLGDSVLGSYDSRCRPTGRDAGIGIAVAGGAEVRTRQNDNYDGLGVASQCRSITTFPPALTD